MQKMSGCVVALDQLPARRIDLGGDGLSAFKLAFGQCPDMSDDARIGREAVCDDKMRCLMSKSSRISDLSAFFRVEWRAIEKDDTFLSFFHLLCKSAVHDEGHDLAFRTFFCVAYKSIWTMGLNIFFIDAFFDMLRLYRLGAARAFFCLVLQKRVGFEMDAESGVFGDE